MVDIWSLAVVTLEYSYGPPNGKSRFKGKNRGREAISVQSLDWCRQLLTYADDWDSEPLTDFLCDFMLKWEAADRKSAANCILSGLGRGLFNTFTGADVGPCSGLIANTTKQLSSEEEQSTIIHEPLWIQEDQHNSTGVCELEDVGRRLLKNSQTAKGIVSNHHSRTRRPRASDSSPDATVVKRSTKRTRKRLLECNFVGTTSAGHNT